MFHNDDNKVIILIENKINKIKHGPCTGLLSQSCPCRVFNITAFSEFQTTWASCLMEPCSGCFTYWNCRRGSAWGQMTMKGTMLTSTRRPLQVSSVNSNASSDYFMFMKVLSQVLSRRQLDFHLTSKRLFQFWLTGGELQAFKFRVGVSLQSLGVLNIMILL